MLPLPRAPECVAAARWPARGLAGLGLRNARLHWPARFSCHGPPPWGPWQLNVDVRHTRNCRATVCNSHATPQPTQRVNASGLVGLCLVVTGTILSPTGVLGLALPCLFALGFGGMAACAASLARKPRWFGVVGLIIGSLCIAFWIAVFVISFAVVHFTAANLRLGVGEHAQIGMSAVALTGVTETQRSPSGAPPASPVLAAVPGDLLVDPWGRPYRYVLTTTPRGFSFLSDGPDRVAGTADDLDILTIQRNGMFPLPPISAPAPAPAPIPVVPAPTGSGR